jgi:hypothetical protein
MRCEATLNNTSTTVTVSGTTITVDLTLRGPQGANGTIISMDNIDQGTTHKWISADQFDKLNELIALLPHIITE